MAERKLCRAFAYVSSVVLVQAGVDVSAVVTAWGTWQPALDPNRRPSVSDALVGSLGDSANGSRVLLDIGAGQGLFSLAAAARGHRAIALEASPLSADPFQVSFLSETTALSFSSRRCTFKVNVVRLSCQM